MRARRRTGGWSPTSFSRRWNPAVASCRKSLWSASSSTLSAQVNAYILLLLRPNAAPLVLPQSSPHHPQLSLVPWTIFSELSLDQENLRLGVRQSSWVSHEFCSIWRWRSKEQRGEQIISSHIFLYFSPMLPICYIHHSLLATCKAKREARDGNIKEGAKEGGKERGSKERGAQEERCVSRGENYLAEKKTRLRWRWGVSSSSLCLLIQFLFLPPSSLGFMHSYLHPLWVLLNHFYPMLINIHTIKNIHLLKYCTQHIFHMQTQQVGN